MGHVLDVSLERLAKWKIEGCVLHVAAAVPEPRGLQFGVLWSAGLEILVPGSLCSY